MHPPHLEKVRSKFKIKNTELMIKSDHQIELFLFKIILFFLI